MRIRHDGARRRSLEKLSPAKARQHGAFVRRHCKEAHHQRAQQEVRGDAQDNANDYLNACHLSKGERTLFFRRP